MPCKQEEHLLGRKLFDQKKYNKAEEAFQQAARGRERTLGRDHKDTLLSKYWLGVTLYQQKKNSEAEEVLGQAAHGWERTLGEDHEQTLRSKCWLGRTLYGQEKYSEAEEVLQQAARRQERTLMQDHEHTLDSKYWLGVTLVQQKKYREAEEELQQEVRGRERIFGHYHEQTLRSKYWLGRTFHEQKKYDEAEDVFRQAVHGQERTLMQDHIHTLNSKYWLGVTLYEQKKYSEAKEMLQQAAFRQERTLGQDYEYTLSTIRLLDMLQPNPSLSLPTKDNFEQTLTSRLNSFFSEGQDSQEPYDREPYTDSEINEISTLLKHSNQRWSRVPRTYVLLRTINHLNLLDDLIDAGFSDYCFPVTERGLPGCLLPSARASFTRAQSLVLSKSIDLEKGGERQHQYYKQGESPPLLTKGILGRGGFGQVDKVLSLISFKEYARKQVPRGIAFRGKRSEDVKLFITEIEILKRLKHRHIVELIGSYTDTRYVALVMSPVAEMDLAAYVARATVSDYPELRTFFGCLATALEYLHVHKIRHKDIKPANILVHHGKVLFTDFGLSFDFTDTNVSTTVSTVNGMTPRYCAPEVAQYSPRNTMSDIWSLGVVFMEMIVVLKGKTIQDMDKFFAQHGSQQPFIRTNVAALSEFIGELEGVGKLSDNCALAWVQEMLSQEQHLRPTASSLVTSITEGEIPGFCGVCCVSFEEEFSDWMDV